MARAECDREQDILDALCAGRWPARCEAELRTHVTSCAICRDVIDAVGPLLEERDVVWTDVQVPSSGTVWWRAQLRARQEAARQAARPIAVAQVVAGAATLVVAVLLGALLSPPIGEWLSRGSDWLPRGMGVLAIELPRFSLPEISRDHYLWWIVVFASATWLALAPIAIYFALDDD